MGCRHKSNITNMPTTHLTLSGGNHKNRVLYFPVVVGACLGPYLGEKEGGKSGLEPRGPPLFRRPGHGGCLRSKRPRVASGSPEGGIRVTRIFLKQTSLLVPRRQALHQEAVSMWEIIAKTPRRRCPGWLRAGRCRPRRWARSTRPAPGDPGCRTGRSHAGVRWWAVIRSLSTSCG